MTDRTRWRWLVVALFAFAALAFAACGGDDDDDDGGGETAAQVEEFPAGTTMADLQQNGEITIGVKFDVPPFGFKNPQSGDVEGFDVDLGKAVAEQLGVEPKLVEAISDNRIPFIQDGTVDVILTGMIIQDDSLKLVGDELTVEPYGAGFKKDDTAFADFLNGVIADYKS